MPNDEMSIKHELQRLGRELKDAEKHGDAPRANTIRDYIKQRTDTLTRLKEARGLRLRPPQG